MYVCMPIYIYIYIYICTHIYLSRSVVIYSKIANNYRRWCERNLSTHTHTHTHTYNRDWVGAKLIQHSVCFSHLISNNLLTTSFFIASPTGSHLGICNKCPKL